MCSGRLQHHVGVDEPEPSPGHHPPLRPAFVSHSSLRVSLDHIMSTKPSPRTWLPLSVSSCPPPLFENRIQQHSAEIPETIHFPLLTSLVGVGRIRLPMYSSAIHLSKLYYLVIVFTLRQKLVRQTVRYKYYTHSVYITLNMASSVTYWLNMVD